MPINCPKCHGKNLDTAITCAACGFPLTPMHSAGYQLPTNTQLQQGRYIIEKTLGEGGFGITYKARDIRNYLDVAIKELCPEKFLRQGINIIWPNSITHLAKQEQIQKFKTEAETLQQCIHPHIVKVYDWFEENNTAYLVMEFVAGKPLSKILKEEGKLAENRAKKYFIQIAEALQVVHGNNLLHRDIKPDNIIINSPDKAILIDFGAAREFLAGITKKMTAMLTPGYAPLEQYANFGKPYPSTDFYAVCASMYHAITGVIPLAATERMVSDNLLPPRQIVRSISVQTEEIILTGMKLQAEDRFQDAEELIAALRGKFVSPSLRQARQLVEEGKIFEAVSAYEECLTKESDNTLAAVELAMLLMRMGDARAADAAHKAVEIQPNDGRSLGVLGLINCQEANWENAASVLQQAAFLAPNESWIQANLAWALAKLGNWENAEKVCDRALELESDSTFALGLKAWILVNRSRWVETIRFARPAITKSKQWESEYRRVFQGWMYPCLTVAIAQELANESAPDSQRCIEEFLDWVPDSGFAWGYRGWKLAAGGEWEDAIANLEKARQQPDAPSWVFLNLGIAYERVGSDRAAIQIYREKLEKTALNNLSFGDDFCLFRLGTLFGLQGQWSTARSYLENARSLNPDYAEAYHNLGWVLFHIRTADDRLENFLEMRAAYSKAAALYQKQKKFDLATRIKQAFQAVGIQLQ